MTTKVRWRIVQETLNYCYLCAVCLCLHVIPCLCKAACVLMLSVCVCEVYLYFDKMTFGSLVFPSIDYYTEYTCLCGGDLRPLCWWCLSVQPLAENYTYTNATCTVWLYVVCI